MTRQHVRTGMRQGGSSWPVSAAPWLVGLSLVAMACTSTNRDAGTRPSPDAASTPSSRGWDARATIAFHADPDGRDDTYVMDATGGHVVPVTDGSETVAQPIWSPDGERLLLGCCTSSFGRLLLSDGPGAPLIEVASDVSGIANPAWSPDGSTIAFGSVDDGMLYVVAVGDGTAGEPRPLGVSGAAPSWSPDGTHIAFVSNSDAL